MRANVLQSTCKSSKQIQHVSACLGSCGSEKNEVAVVEEEEEVVVVVVVVVSFLFKPSSLFSFDLDFVAFNSLSCCRGSGTDGAVVVAVVVVVLVVAVWFLPSLVCSSASSFFGTVATASLNFLHSLRCPPFFQ